MEQQIQMVIPPQHIERARADVKRIEEQIGCWRKMIAQLPNMDNAMNAADWMANKHGRDGTFWPDDERRAFFDSWRRAMELSIETMTNALAQTKAMLEAVDRRIVAPGVQLG